MNAPIYAYLPATGPGWLFTNPGLLPHLHAFAIELGKVGEFRNRMKDLPHYELDHSALADALGRGATLAPEALVDEKIRLWKRLRT